MDSAVATKVCTCCQQEKPVEEFYPRKSRSKNGGDPGRVGQCKKCLSLKHKAYLKTDAGKAQMAQRYQRYGRFLQKRIKYGLTTEQFTAMLERTKVCEICHNPFEGKEPMIDHCHETGKVRGLLCLRCNSILGFAKDQVKVLESAIQYLRVGGESHARN